MDIKHFMTVGVLLLAANHVAAQHVYRDFVIADSLTKRLQPTKHPLLPKDIGAFLEHAGYSIPQSWMDTIPHNVIGGAFKKLGQSDVAVLACRNRMSSIIIFWGGSISDTSHLNMVADLHYMQDEGTNGILFSRVIQQCPMNSVLEYFKKSKVDEPERGQPDVVDHDAIEDYFIPKASTILFFHNARWFVCAGAD